MAYEDSTRRDPSIIFLAGPIKYWWSCWGSPEHERYARWREALRSALVTEGYLTYAPHDAFKGAWTERAQAINNAAILASDLVVTMRPILVVTAEGTEAELQFAKEHGKRIGWFPPDFGLMHALTECRQMGLTATPY